MILDNFKLKAAAMEIDYNKPLRIIGQRNGALYGAKYYRIQSEYEGVPLYFKMIIFDEEDAIDLRDLKGIIENAQKKIDSLKDNRFSLQHKDYIQIMCHEIWGKEYEKIEELDPRVTWTCINEYLDKIYEQKGDNFKAIYKEFVDTFNIQKLSKNVEKRLEDFTLEIV